MVLNSAFRVFRILQGSSSLHSTVNTAVREQSNPEIPAACWKIWVKEWMWGSFLSPDAHGWLKGKQMNGAALRALTLPVCQRDVWAVPMRAGASEGWGNHGYTQNRGECKALISLCFRRICSDKKLVLSCFSFPSLVFLQQHSSWMLCVMLRDIPVMGLCTCCLSRDFTHRDTPPKCYFSEWQN